jgi:catechol 2,3-dioxygenase-like lactoylglutathione lyase family enzyme
MLECVIPILRVKDMAASITYYETRLGFEEEWRHGDMASVWRDGFSIYLNAGDQGSAGTWVWIGVEDVDSLYAEFKASGALFRQQPTNYSWGFEMRVEDPDGHVLRCASGPKADLPFND